MLLNSFQVTILNLIIFGLLSEVLQLLISKRTFYLGLFFVRFLYSLGFQPQGSPSFIACFTKQGLQLVHHHNGWKDLQFMTSCLLFAASKYAGYINSFHICSTVKIITLTFTDTRSTSHSNSCSSNISHWLHAQMGPGFPVSIQSLSKAADHYNKVHLKA